MKRNKQSSIIEKISNTKNEYLKNALNYRIIIRYNIFLTDALIGKFYRICCKVTCFLLLFYVA